MDFWCHASALFALSWARACNSDLSSRRACSWHAAAAAVRTPGAPAVSQSTQRETVASSICVSICVVTRAVLVHACSSRLDESRCHHCPPSSSPSPSRSPSPHLPSATASPSSSPHRPLPHLHLHSCPRTRTLILTSLHCARRCRLLGASVGAISSLCDTAVSGAHRARLLCARRGYLVGRSLSAALLAALLWSTSGPKVSAGACASGSRLTPGGVQAIPRARLPLGVRCGPRHHRSPAAPPSRGVV